MKRTILNITPHKQAKAIFTIVILFAVMIIYGLTNHFNRVVVPGK